MKGTNFYERLGVPRDASDEDIRKAYRDLALRLHPDRNKDKGAEDQLKDINEAWSTLSKKDKRLEYDSTLPAETKREQSREQSRSTSSSNENRSRATRQSSESPFDQMFRGAFPGTEWIFNGEQSQFSKQFFGDKPTDDFFYLTEADKGLFLALKQAYDSKTDGKWEVTKGPEDNRRGIPTNIYSVKRENGKVNVFRTVADWRNPNKRDDRIDVRDKEEEWKSEKDKHFDATTLLGEYYLIGEGINLVKTTSVLIPRNFDDFLRGIKKLSYKLSDSMKDKEGSVGVRDEIEMINSYYGSSPRGVRKPDSSLYKDDPERLTLQKIGVKDFWKQIRSAEGLVRQVEGNSNQERRDYSSGENKA